MVNLLVTVVHLLAVLATGYCYQNNCNKGSNYWCRNYETASECGVLEYCKISYPNNLNKGKDVIADPVKSTTPVKIELYYEGLCGGCRMFIMQQLMPTFQTLAKTGIMDIALYPYGNADETLVGKHWKFDCQHGEEECAINLLETCAIKYFDYKPSEYMPFINCIESGAKFSNARKCADEFKLSWDALSLCYNGSLGNELEHQVALKTASLEPRHTYVPWITVNGLHTNELQEDAQLDLFNLVCKMYKGEKPKECKSARKCYK